MKAKVDTYISFIFYFLAFFTCASSQTCERSHYENCLNKLLSFTDKGDLLFASTPEELQQECIQARSSLHCLTTFTKKCLPPEDRPKFTEGISGPERITLGLCTQDEFKSSFIKSVPCLRNISDGLQYCKEKYERNQKDIILVEYEDKTHLQCCSFDGYRRCLRMVLDTQNECREKTSDFLAELSERMGGAMTQGLCSEHFERCTGHSSAIQNLSSRLMWLVSLLSILLLL